MIRNQFKIKYWPFLKCTLYVKKSQYIKIGKRSSSFMCHLSLTESKLKVVKEKLILAFIEAS